MSFDNSDLGLSGNRIISVVNIQNFLEGLVCSTCFEKIVFSEEKLVGQASTIYFLCGCDSRLALHSSDFSRKSKHFQVNDRLQVATYGIGCHYEAARIFCANMDVDLQARMALTVATVNGLSSKIIDTETLTNHCNKCKATTNGN